MQIINIQGTIYLGELDTEFNVTVHQAMQVHSENVTKQDFCNYIKAENVGTLIEKAYNGDVTYSVMELTEVQEMEYTIASMQFEVAQKNALAKLQNKEFDALVKNQ